MSYSRQFSQGGGEHTSSRKTNQATLAHDLERRLSKQKKKTEILKEDNENLITQLSFLNEEIKKYKIESEEKNQLISKILKNSKPVNEKQVYEDCTKQFNQRFSNQSKHDGNYSEGKYNQDSDIDIDEESANGKKKSFLSSLK